MLYFDEDNKNRYTVTKIRYDRQVQSYNNGPTGSVEDYFNNSSTNKQRLDNLKYIYIYIYIY